DTGVRLVEPPPGRGAVGVPAQPHAACFRVVGGGAVPRLVTLVRVGGGEDSDDGATGGPVLGGFDTDVVERHTVQRGDLVFEPLDVAESAAVRDQQLDVELEPAGHGGEAGEARVGEGSVVAEVLAEPGEARVFDGGCRFDLGDRIGGDAAAPGAPQVRRTDRQSPAEEGELHDAVRAGGGPRRGGHQPYRPGTHSDLGVPADLPAGPDGLDVAGE